MRGGAKMGIVGGAFAVVAGGVAWGGLNLYNGLTGGSDGSDPGLVSQAAPRSAAPVHDDKPLTAAEVNSTAKKFLTAWAKGTSPQDAAGLTDAATEAEPYFADFRDSAHVTKAVITPDTVSGTTVPFSVHATVSYHGTSKPWVYRSQLTVVRGAAGQPLVQWSPAVVHPDLTDTTTLVTDAGAPPPVEAVDRTGRALDAKEYPSLGPVLTALRERYGKQAGGSPGVTLRVEDRDDGSGTGQDGAARVLLTLSKGRPGKVPTTIDPRVQAAAESAVRKYTNASVVAVRPSTGDILAVANHRADGFNAALQGAQAPGSTMKIVTSALLMEKGLASPDQPMECPPTATYYGRTFHNEDSFSLKQGSTMRDAFAQSCNTAFIKLIDDTKDDAGLSKEAGEVFDLGNNNWKTGVVSFDGKVPAETGGEAAAEYIGQGTVQMNALDMASVTATVRAGVFHQPVLVPQSFDHRQVATARRQLPASVAQSIVGMMRTTAVSGTAANAMAGLGGDKGAKTGSAEVDGQAVSNSWFTAFQNDCAATAVVDAGGHGADAAGPLVASVLAAD
ncbi:penicillin-binding transpeptidase domain-containing protein [Streptomyces fuscigenes]|uniref:penicillin-binding transpeptidase domain-containing protein n=1 Tax=Streptomyces fuscigenes TaxID=1528880 RepID=UPI001F279D58|nr:penicillin-binding transpeptidase domain-containing protein [Streptomyces fuscigenes]MCF3964820.1 penicillin-binding protein [Streptomyces fuscigenes]